MNNGKDLTLYSLGTDKCQVKQHFKINEFNQLKFTTHFYWLEICPFNNMRSVFLHGLKSYSPFIDSVVTKKCYNKQLFFIRIK